MDWDCKKHKRYKAIRKPRVQCLWCWIKWFERHPCAIDAAHLLKMVPGWHSVLTPILCEVAEKEKR